MYVEVSMPKVNIILGWDNVCDEKVGLLYEMYIIYTGLGWNYGNDVWK